MKKIYLLAGLLSAATMFTGCGMSGTGAQATQKPASANASASNAGGLMSMLGSVLGLNSSLKQADLLGTWTYASPECLFESENLLKKAGGEVAAAQVEKKLEEQFTKIGIKAGVSKYTFAEDGSYQMTIGSRTISGTYTFDEKAQTVTMSAALGLFSSTALVEKSGNSLSLLYDADKLLSVVSSLGALSGNKTVSGLSSLLGSYDGMKIGFKMSK